MVEDTRTKQEIARFGGTATKKADTAGAAADKTAVQAGMEKKGGAAQDTEKPPKVDLNTKEGREALRAWRQKKTDAKPLTKPSPSPSPTMSPMPMKKSSMHRSMSGRRA